MDDLKYEAVCEVLSSEFPEFRQKFEKELAWWLGPDTPGPYHIFGFVIQPAVRDLLASDVNPVLLHRVFDFFERMAQSSDIQVANLLGIEIFEWLVGDAKGLATAWQYMGKQTKELARQTARWQRREMNLPKE